MNYYKNQDLEQVIEEGDRQPTPATKHVALGIQAEAKPRKDRTLLKVGMFMLIGYGYALVANAIELPNTIHATVSAILIGIFVYVSIKGGSNVPRD
jgi:hypothetical protein